MRTFEQPGCIRISANARACKSWIESRVFAMLLAALFQGVGDLVFDVAGLVIAAELAERGFVEVRHDLAQFLGGRIARGKTPSVELSHPAQPGVALRVAGVALRGARALV